MNLFRLPAEVAARCPACGDIIDFCQGHGETGDYVGYVILEQHDAGDHKDCHPIGCSELFYRRSRDISVPRRIP